MAQLGEHRVAMRDVVSSTQGLKITEAFPSTMWSAWCNLLNGLLIDETTDSSQIEGFQVLKTGKKLSRALTLFFLETK